MGRRTISGHKLTFNRSRHRGDIVPPACLMECGLADLFENWTTAKVNAGVVHVSDQNYLRVAQVIRFNQSIVIVDTLAGKAGERGEVYNIENGNMLFELTDRDVPTSNVRAILFSPPRGRMALWFSEYSARSSGASLLLTLFKREWKSVCEDITFNKERLIASEIAIEDGLVTEVEVRLDRRSDDRANGNESLPGVVSHKFKPSKHSPLSGRLISAIRKNPAKAYELVGLSSTKNNSENEEIFVSVDVAGRHRKVQLFNPDDGIYFREELNDSSHPILTNDEIVAFCSEEAEVFFQRSGGEWEQDWSRQR